MKILWAVSRQTFAECLRMKIAVGFIVLLACCLAGVPLLLRGDGTLAGQVRTLLSYSVSLTGGLLSIVTVLVTVAVVSEDVRTHTIELLAVKPMARWQYMLGRWLGVVLLAGLLLAIGGTSTYLLAEHYREKPAMSPADRSAVEKEVFTARIEVKPVTPDFRARAAEMLQTMQQQEPSRYESILADFQSRQGVDPDDALNAMLEETIKQVVSEYETVGPYQSLQWRFEGLALEEEPLEVSAEVLLHSQALRRIRLSAPSSMLGRLVYGGPVRVADVPGEVVATGQDFVDVRFAESDFKQPFLAGLSAGQTVPLLAEPTLQFQYKVTPIGSTGGRETLYRVLTFLKPTGQRVYGLAGETALRSPVTVTIPATGVLEDGRIVVEYANVPPATGPRLSVQVPAKDVSIRYRVGGFAMNYLRAMLLVFFQLAFLAAMGVFFGSFLTFPVAALACLVLLGAGWLTNWLSQSVSWDKVFRGDFDPIGLLGALVLEVVRVLLPNLEQTSPSDRLVDGLLVPWKSVASAALWAMLVRGTFYLGLGCVIFHRRELSRVQV